MHPSSSPCPAQDGYSQLSTAPGLHQGGIRHGLGASHSLQNKDLTGLLVTSGSPCLSIWRHPLPMSPCPTALLPTLRTPCSPILPSSEAWLLRRAEPGAWEPSGTSSMWPVNAFGPCPGLPGTSAGHLSVQALPLRPDPSMEAGSSGAQASSDSGRPVSSG